MKRNLKFLSKVILIFTVLGLFAIPDSGFAQNKANKIDELMTLCYDYGQFNGPVLVAEGGKVIYKKGFGLANMEWNIPNEPDTKFRIGSNTKQFTSMLIMQLVEEGKVKLNDKITDYLPEYRKDTGDKVTIYQLLTHTSGIPDYANLPGFFPDSIRNHYSLDYLVKKFCSGDLEFEPGKKFKYSSSGYVLLGIIIEKVTGKSFKEVLWEKILRPLKMYNTGVDNNKIILEKRAYGYMKENFEYVNEPYYYIPNAYAAGDMYSTVEDLYLWDQALYTEKLLSEKYKKIMFKPHGLTAGLPTYGASYGYGWLINKLLPASSEDSLVMIWHQGYIAGFNTMISRLVDDKHLVVIFNNTGHSKLWDINLAIVNILYDSPYDLPKKSIFETLAKTIAEKDVESAIEQYHDLKEKYSDDYDFAETELNNLGYQLLGMKKIKEAIKIFKLNVDVFPESSNVYDSLGEAYMINGDKEFAIKNYEKSLELNPDNKNAIEMLKKLHEK